ncbi:MAG: aminopeptidase N [Phycisphaerales bacterium]|jgi:aminopeptidase N
MTRTITAAVLAVFAGAGLASGPAMNPTPSSLQVPGDSTGQYPAYRTIPGTDFRGCGKGHFADAMASAGFGPGGESEFPQAIRAASTLSETDLTHVDLDIEVLFGAASLAGTSTMTLDSLVDGLATFNFQLATNLTVSSVTVDGVAASFTTQPDGTRVVTLPSPKNTGDTFVVAVEYNGATVSGFFGSIDWINVQDDNPPTDRVSSQMVYTLSQPYYSYTWWPCKDAPLGGAGDYSDKFTLDFSITAPNTFKSTANGVLQSVDALSGNRDRYNYSHSYEIPTYLVAFATSNFNTEQRIWNYSDGVNDYAMPLDVWFTQSNDQTDPGFVQPREEWFKMGDMLTVFSDLFGVYPFHTERYGMYEFGFPGGMEHQTNTGQIGWFFADWLTAHEAAHQWFGDWVTCKTWHDIWFQEGMADYAEVLYEEFQAGEPDPDARRINLMNGPYYPFDLSGSAYVYDTADPDRMFNYSFTYLRGGWVWHMIRGLAGDEAFFQATRDFMSWYGQSGATTQDILAAMNLSTGLDFTDLFDDYVYGGGAPQYQYAWESVNVGGQDYLRIKLSQAQSVNDGAGGVFEIPLPIRINGSDTLTLLPTIRDHFFTIPTPVDTTFFEVDPEAWVLKRFSVQALLTDAPPVVVGAAADDLGASFTFIDGVSLSAADFAVVTNDVLETPQAFTLAYSAGTMTASLDFGAGLPAGDYVAIIADTVVSSVEGVALDGDSVNGALPSGDGAAGGAYRFEFNVANSCPADTNGDGILDQGDIQTFIALFLVQDLGADFNGDSIVDLGDIQAFIGFFLAGC